MENAKSLSVPKHRRRRMGKHKYCIATMALCGDRKTGMLPHTYGLAQMHGRQVSAWGSVSKDQGESVTGRPQREQKPVIIFCCESQPVSLSLSLWYILTHRIHADSHTFPLAVNKKHINLVTRAIFPLPLETGSCVPQAVPKLVILP